jgi:glucokinase
MILAGDIGGTKCNLAVFRQAGQRLEVIFQSRYATRDFSSFEQVLESFGEAARAQAAIAGDKPFAAAGFGVAGTVLDGRLHAINLPWQLDPASLASKLSLNAKNVVFMNDLVATAWGLDKLERSDLFPLNDVTPRFHSNKAFIAAGTGLGEAILYWDGRRYVAAPSEGGAADFAPRTDLEIRLLQFLKQDLPRVSCEEVFSGRAFKKIHKFVNPGVRHPVFDEPSGDSAREISQNAVSGACEVCVETLDLWMDAFGAETGNLALRVLAYGGVYLAGGIAVKILQKLKESAFCRSFSEKAPLTPILSHIPIFVILNEDAPLLGAAYQALETVNARSHACV